MVSGTPRPQESKDIFRGAADSAEDRTKGPSAHPYVPPLPYAERKPAADAPRDWLGQGYLRPGAVTLWTSARNRRHENRGPGAREANGFWRPKHRAGSALVLGTCLVLSEGYRRRSVIRAFAAADTAHSSTVKSLGRFPGE
jgi:hypothetical protein